ncbi:MAG: hypothetical protein GXP55_22405 [Deltaproteobacteria bacterium]|nr:hypothetical protein [Deltaproteobacteria bacterium]
MGRVSWLRGSALVLLALTLPLAHGQAQPPLVEISAEGLFGDSVGMPSGDSMLRITLHNRGTTNLSGSLEVANGFGGSVPPHRMRLDLPPGATRLRLFPIRRDGMSSPVVRYRVGRRELGRSSVNLPYGGAAGVVVMAESSSLRVSLDGMSIERQDPYGGVRNVSPPLGDVAMAPLTGDPLLPDQPLGWGGVELFISEASLLERIGPAERRALAAWVRGGGTLLVFPRTEADLHLAYLREWVGDITRREVGDEGAPRYARASTLVPENSSSVVLIGDSHTTAEEFGLSAPFGFGRVFVASYDMAAPDVARGTAPPELVRAILSRPKQRGVSAPLFSPGVDDTDGLSWTPTVDRQAMRSALDPNESFRPALGLVAVVLLLYVFAVGPLNFSWVERRGKPVLALLTTPIVAALCLFLLLAVGYIGKGTRMRYRRVQIAELREADSLGTTRIYTGLFAARPVSFDLEPAPLGNLYPALVDDAVKPEWVDVSDGRARLRDMRAALWETAFLREDGTFDLGGSVTFEREGARLARVQNHTPHALLGAVVIDAAGSVYEVGDVPAGGEASIPMAASSSVDANSTFYGDTDPRLGQLARALGLDPDEELDTDALFGVARLVGSITTAPLPSLWARLENEGDAPIAGIFAREHELRLLRILPDTPSSPVTRAPLAGSAPPMGGPR